MDKMIQDVIPPKNKSIRDIPVPQRKVISAVRQRSAKNSDEHEEVSDIQMMPPKKSCCKNLGLWILAFAVVLGSTFAISYVFSGAVLIVTPKQKDVAADLVITAKKDAIPGDLEFGYIQVGKALGADAVASGEEFIERKASGTIVVYNNFSASPQRLIKSTRFETPRGLIYRLESAITVPGKKTVNGQILPGSIEVHVSADVSGPKYNIDLTDFTVPGFKDDPARFKGFYARSKTAMAGGFSGTVKKVLPAVRTSTEEKLKTDLLIAVKSLANAQMPEKSIFYNDAIFTVFTTLPQTDTSGSSTRLNIAATSTAVFFNEVKISEYLAKTLIPDYDGSPIRVSNLDSLLFSVRNKSAADPATTGVMSFSLKGPVHFVWIVDSDKLKKDLSSKPKKDLGQLLVNYHGIDKAEAVVRPFWKTAFPANANKIKIDVRQVGTEQ